MERKITDLLDCIQDDTVQIRTKDVASLERIKELAMKKADNINTTNATTYKRTRKVSTILIAAILAVTLLTGAAFAANLSGLGELILPDGQMISLQGYADSDEYKALAEWLAFQESYDQDGSILDEIGNSETGLDVSYLIYGAYTQDMADKIDEIAEKYSLGTLGKMTTFSSYEELWKAVAYGDFIGEANTAYGGYLFETGTFQFEGSIGKDTAEPVDAFGDLFSGGYVIFEYPASTSPEDVINKNDDFADMGTVVFVSSDGAEIFLADYSSGELVLVPCEEDSVIAKAIKGEYPLTSASEGFEFRYCAKGVFDYVPLNIGNIEDYTQWQYETDCGVTVSLSQSAHKSIIILETEAAFITVNILEGNESFTASELEVFADTLDFSLLK